MFIFRSINEHLIIPFQESAAPIPWISRAATIGIFVGLTPTMGIQMYIVAIIWILGRYVFGFRFHLPIAVGLVWISNPVTVFPLYYLYLISGDWALELVGRSVEQMSYEQFKELFLSNLDGTGASYLNKLVGGVVTVFWTFGWPILVGSLLWAIPLTAITYPVSTITMLKYRHYRAAREGMSYKEWKHRNIKFD